MGKGSKPTVGYWYLPAFHVGLGIGPIDAYLEARGGDKTAWAGRLTASGTIHINAPNLWGGEKDQGGIVGDMDVMFGEAGQMPNPYLISTFGDQQPAWRGLATLVFKGGKYGAMSPYPQPMSHKIEKIVEGWDGDGCWYPEKARIAFGADTGALTDVVAVGATARPSAGGADWSRSTSPVGFIAGYAIGAGDRFIAWDLSAAGYTDDALVWHGSAGFLGGSGGARMGVYFGGSILIAGGLSGYFVSTDKAVSFSVRAYPDFPRLTLVAGSASLMVAMGPYDATLFSATSVEGPWSVGAMHGLTGSHAAFDPKMNRFVFVGSDIATSVPRAIATESGALITDLVLPAFATASTCICAMFSPAASGHGVIGTNSGEIAYRHSDGTWLLSADVLGEPGIGVQWVGNRFIMWGATLAKESATGQSWTSIDLQNTGVKAIATGATIDTRNYALAGINPAHALYYARTHSEIGREPIANINDTSSRASADKLYAEAFGICTEYDPSAESLVEYEQRICNLIGGSINRSLVDGQYYLDLARGDYVLEDLPILTDDDILSFAEQPSILDNAINSVSVKYFDPVRKETIVTPPVQALALIDAFGTIHQVKDYPEIPTAALAARIAERDLRTSVTPTRAFDLVTKRKPYDWRPNTYFRLQVPKRGIADMVCLLGSKETGTLKSGAIKITAVQDIYSLPDTSYIEVEHGVDTRPPQTPVAIVLQRVFEAPYIEVVANLSRADLAALPGETGYLLAVAADPAQSRDYTMRVAPDGGDYIEANNGDWCPNATTVGGIGLEPGPVVVALASSDRLDQVVVGKPVLIDDEIFRVDAIDIVAPSVTLGRGCADTVPAIHAAGSRLWFFADHAAIDTTEYTDGETINVKLLTNTGSQQLAEDLATAMPLTFDQRQFRPYPPGLVRINGEAAPPYLFGEITATWAHRDRELQADQLVDHEMASIGPEAGQTTTLRWYLDNVLVQTHSALSGTSQAYTPSADGQLRIEIESVRDSLASAQKHVRTLTYTTTESTPLETLAGDLITTLAGDPIFMR